MQIHILPQDLMHQISIVQRAVSGRTTMSILECIRFEAKNGEVILTASDQELTIETRTPCQVEEEGVFVVPSTMIGNIFRKLPQAMATLTEKNRTLDIQCGRSKFQLQLPNSEDFPVFSMEEEQEGCIIQNELLKSAIEQTEFAVSNDDKHQNLMGIYLSKRGSRMDFVALDGYRIAVHRLELEEDFGEDFERIVPKRTMSELARVIDERGNTTIYTNDYAILFSFEGTKIQSRCIDKEYVPYASIIPVEFKTTVVLSREDLLGGLERASLLAKEEKANLIKMYFEEQQLYITSNTEIGHVNEEILMERNGEVVRIAFNSRYILEGIRAMKEKDVKIALNGPLNPILITPVEEMNYMYVVLPVRVAVAKE